MRDEELFTFLSFQVFPSQFLWDLIFSEEMVPCFKICLVFISIDKFFHYCWQERCLHR